MSLDSAVIVVSGLQKSNFFPQQVGRKSLSFRNTNSQVIAREL